jgi:hypothetical protein
MAALVVSAIDQETTNASGSHFSEGDFLLAAFWRSAGSFGHRTLKRGPDKQATLAWSVLQTSPALFRSRSLKSESRCSIAASVRFKALAMTKIDLPAALISSSWRSSSAVHLLLLVVIDLVPE